MKYMVEWSIQAHNFEAAVARFTQEDPGIPEGVTLVGRWHQLGTGKGYTLLESDDPAAIARLGISWADLVDQQISPVTDDEGIGEALS